MKHNYKYKLLRSNERDSKINIRVKNMKTKDLKINLKRYLIIKYILNKFILSKNYFKYL
jgi:hypothetical protein